MFCKSEKWPGILFRMQKNDVLSPGPSRDQPVLPADHGELLL